MDRPTKLLVTFLGTGPYYSTEYYLYPDRRRTFVSSMTCAAIAHLAGPFDGIVALVTRQSSEVLPQLEESLGEYGRMLNSVQIPEGSEEEDFLGSLDILISILEKTGAARSELMLDITHGFRHTPLIYFAAMNYLDCFRNARLSRVLYARLEKNAPQTPIVDVTSAFTFVQWSQSIRTFLDAGRVDPLAELVMRRRSSLGYSDVATRKLDDLLKALRGLVHPLGHVLPIEIGHCSSSLIGQIQAVVDDAFLPRVFAHALNELACQIRPMQIREPVSRSEIRLTKEELQRQLSVVDWFLKKNRIGDALLLLREYVMNVMLLEANPENWLAVAARTEVQHRLSALLRMRCLSTISSELSLEQSELADKWNVLRRLRNTYAHAGFGQNEIRASRDLADLKSLVEYCRKLEPIPLGLRAIHEKLLVTPMGLASGVLFSAIHQVRPDSIVIISSKESSSSVNAVLSKTDFDSAHVMNHVIEDPHLGFDEIPSLVGDCRLLTIKSRVVVCNVTGGTTLLGEVSRAVGTDALSLGIPTQFVAMVDRRPAEEQKANPFVVGDMIHLPNTFESVSDTE